MAGQGDIVDRSSSGRIWTDLAGMTQGALLLRRRTVLQAIAGVFGITCLENTKSAHGQAATPGSDGEIPPIRWILASIDTQDDALIPDDPTRYTVQFLGGNLVYIGADCNSASGRYSIDGTSIAITDIITTLMMCPEGSLDQEFLEGLQEATSFSINTDSSDQLGLATGPDGQQMLFDASLVGVTWQWQAFTGDDEIQAPDDPGRYTLEFADDNSIHVQADCNNGRGDAEIDGDQILLTVATTRKACAEGSRYDDFMRVIREASSFYIRDGQLHLTIPDGIGEAIFGAVPPETPAGAATPVAI
jgi:heat shock protein HslJ